MKANNRFKLRGRTIPIVPVREEPKQATTPRRERKMNYVGVQAALGRGVDPEFAVKDALLTQEIPVCDVNYHIREMRKQGILTERETSKLLTRMAEWLFVRVTGIHNFDATPYNSAISDATFEDRSLNIPLDILQRNTVIEVMIQRRIGSQFILPVFGYLRTLNVISFDSTLENLMHIGVQAVEAGIRISNEARDRADGSADENSTITGSIAQVCYGVGRIEGHVRFDLDRFSGVTVHLNDPVSFAYRVLHLMRDCGIPNRAFETAIPIILRHIGMEWPHITVEYMRERKDSVLRNF